MSFKCYACELGMGDGVALFRQNAKGEDPVWACRQHTKPVDETTWQLVTAIEDGQKKENV